MKRVELRNLITVAKALHAYIIFNLNKIGIVYNGLANEEELYFTEHVPDHILQHTISLALNESFEDNIRSIMNHYKDDVLPLVIDLAEDFNILKKDNPTAKIKFGFLDASGPFPSCNVGLPGDLIILHVAYSPYLPRSGLTLTCAMDIREATG